MTVEYLHLNTQYHGVASLFFIELTLFQIGASARNSRCLKWKKTKAVTIAKIREQNAWLPLPTTTKPSPPAGQTLHVWPGPHPHWNFQTWPFALFFGSPSFLLFPLRLPLLTTAVIRSTHFMASCDWLQAGQTWSGTPHWPQPSDAFHSRGHHTWGRVRCLWAPPNPLDYGSRVHM